MVLRTFLALAICGVAAAQDLSEIESRVTALEFDANENAARELRPLPPGGFYGDVQFMFLRADAGSGLEEQYKLAPRAVLGYEDGAGLRFRYWQYDYLLQSAQPQNDLIGIYSYNIQAQRVDLRAFDLELTGNFQRQHTDARISGGVRWASLGIDLARKYYVSYEFYNYYHGIDVDMGPPQYMHDIRKADIELFGPTFATDARTRLWRGLSGVYGGRISLLGGDWSGNPLWLGNPGRDTFVVSEVSTGLEYSHGSMMARIVYEYQHWQSDAFDSYSTISFDGVGAHIGFSY